MRRWTVTAAVWPAAAALVGGAVWFLVSPAFVADTEQSRPLPPARTRPATPSPSAAPLAQVRPRESASPTPRPTPSPVVRTEGPDSVVRVVYTDGGVVTLTYDHGKVTVTSVEPYDREVRVTVDGDRHARLTVRLEWMGHVSTVEAYWEKPGVTRADVFEDDGYGDEVW
ncbi:hypothetical protein AB0M43_06180 [Longispora sp. NPDC051575]|uniref:hypothetical protein n=1 Tax=Longispora sp. NPDC051575 TaxID=3154943 RepID=UPI003435440F